MIRFLGSTLLFYVKNIYPVLGSRERERERESKSPRLNSFVKTLLTLLISVFFFSLAHTSVYATTYYVANAGNDSCDGTSQTIGSSGACAWKTIAKVNASSFSAGDSISFNKGDTWREQLTVPVSGTAGSPITFGAYGDSALAKPKIYGSTQVTTWMNTNPTAPTGNLLNEGFEATNAGGYAFATAGVGRLDNTGWTGTLGSGSVLDADNTDIARPTGGGAQLLKVQKISANFNSKAAFNMGAAKAITYFTGYVNITAESISAGDVKPLLFYTYSGSDLSTTRPWTIKLYESSTGHYKLNYAVFNNGAFASTNSQEVYLNTWVRVDVLYDSTNLLFSFLVNGIPVASGSLTGTLRGNPQYVAVGDTSNDVATTFYVDRVTVDSTGFVPESPLILPAGTWKASYSSLPVALWFIGTDGTIHWGKQESVLANVDTEYDWYFDSANNYLIVYAASTPDTRYSSVEAATRQKGILATGKSYVTIQGLEIAFAAFSGVDLSAASDYGVISGNTIHHTGALQSVQADDIIIGSSNCLVTGNILHDGGRHSLFLFAGAGITVSNNIVEHNSLYDSAHTTGVDIQNVGGTVSGNVVRYNTIFNTSSFPNNTHANQSLFMQGNSGFVVDGTQIYYNIFTQTMGTAINHDHYVINTLIANNVIYGSASDSLGTNIGIEVQATGVSGVVVVNNICQDMMSAGGSSNTCFYAVDKTKFTSVDHNVWYQSNNTKAYTNVDGTAYYYTDKAAYQLATGFEAHGLWQDPLFFNTGIDFHLQPTSPAINAGANVSLTSDYAGTTVPQGSAQDIGAYEYIPLTATINQATGQADPTNSSTINFTVVFSESVSDFTTGDVTLSGTAGATTGTVTGSGTTYNVAVTGMTGGGTVIASLAVGVATGATGNTNAVSTSTDNTVTYDITPPTLTSITISDSSGFTNSVTPTITIVSSGSPSHVAFSCDGGTNWSSWITYADSISSFNITNGATGCTTSDGSKTITAKLADAATNESSTANDSTYYDTTAPTLSSKTTFTGWYTSNQTSSFTYTDSGGSGIASGTPVTCNITTEGSSQTCSITPNVCDALGNCNTTLVTSNGANIDKTAPASGSIGYTNGYFTSASVPLTVGDGTDGNSGVNTTTRTFQRQSASLLLGICGIYGSFSPITPTATVAYPNFTDTTVVSGNCYKYEYQVSDTAGNQATYTTGNAARIDTSNPSTPGTPSITNPNNSSSQNWTWIAATDAISDVANYLWRTTGTAIASGSSAVNSVTTTLADGLYNFFIKAVDTAGNQGSEISVSNIRVDTTAPSVPGMPTTASLTTVNKPVWTWTASTDSGSGLAATPYSVQWCGNSSFTGCDANTDTATTNTYTHATALTDGTWYFRVKATDTAGNSSAYSSSGTDTINTTATTNSNNSNTSSNSNSSGSSTSSPGCNDSAPTGISDLFQINVNSTTAKLFFTPLSSTNRYYISFSTKPNAEENGADVALAKEGVQNFTVSLLKPNTTYYFKVHGQNGCMAGNWSNIVKITTRAKGSTKTTLFYKTTNIFQKIVSKVVSTFSSKKISKSNTAPTTTVTPDPIPTTMIQPKTETSRPITVPTPVAKKSCFLWWCK